MSADTKTPVHAAETLAAVGHFATAAVAAGTTAPPTPKTPLQVAQALVEQADRVSGLDWGGETMVDDSTRRAYLELLCEARQWYALKPALTEAEIAKLIERV